MIISYIKKRNTLKTTTLRHQINKVNIFFHLSLLIFSFLTNIGLGKAHTGNIFSSSHIILYIFLLLIFSSSRIIGLITSSILFITSIIYYPAGVSYGGPSFGIIVSIYETNINETLEYLSSIPNYIYILMGIYFCIFISTIYASKQASSSINLIKKQKIFILIWITLLSYILIKPISGIIKSKSSNISYSYYLSQSKFYPLSFYSEMVRVTSEYFKQKHFLDESFNKDSKWEIISASPKYKNYILIIGESMRKDYMSLYGYPIVTTPFLDKINGTIFNNYYSAAPNTQPSLQRTLYRQENYETVYTDNIISLLKLVGIKTYWLSNQGKMGEFDTMASRLGINADYNFFTKNLGYDSAKKFDFELLPKFKEILEKEKNTNKLIVLHLMGSHPIFCERLPYKVQNYFINQQMSCYLESIKYTDKFIESVNDLLVKNGESFSVIYFSDHGLAHKNDSLYVSNLYKQDYEVPFIMFSSDSIKRIEINEKQSAFNFMYGFTQWLGIKEKHLSGVDFFNPKEQKIKVFDWENIIDVNLLKDDPAKLH